MEQKATTRLEQKLDAGKYDASQLVEVKIPLNLPYLFISDSASYMKKCYKDVLKPIMPQLIHLPCPAHIMNLIG